MEALLTYPQALAGLQSLGFSTDDILDTIGSMVRGFFDVYTQKQGKSRWVDKTPNYYRLLPLIDVLFREHVLYLFLLRHPLDCIDSLEQARCFTSERLEDPDVARAVRLYGRGREGWGKYWVDVAENLERFSTRNPERCLVLYYEDLVVSPNAVIHSLLDFLEEETPDELAEQAFRVAHTNGYQDWKIKETSAIHANSVGKWQEWPSDEVRRIWKVVGPTASRFGYSTLSPYHQVCPSTSK